MIEFSEKPQTREGWINGAFFVLEPEVFDYIDGDETHWEKEPLEQLGARRPTDGLPAQLFLAVHGYAAGKEVSRELWESGNAPWKIWEEKHASTSNGSRGIHRNGAGAHAVAAGHELTGLDSDLFERCTFGDGIA